MAGGPAAHRQWAEQIQSCLLPVEYYHVITSAPRPVTEFGMLNAKAIYPLMLLMGAEAILRLARTWEGLLAETAALALLHTWGQLMNLHLHSHNMVPAGALSLDGRRWIGMPPGEFLPRDPLRRIYRDLFVNELRKLYRAGKLAFAGRLRRIEAPGAFEDWLGALSEIDWVIRLRSVWDRSGPQDLEAANKTVEYLARYANRVAISNSRLVAIESDQVVFCYKDYREGASGRRRSCKGWSSSGAAATGSCSSAEGICVYE